MGPKIVIFCALAAIANGGVIEKIKRSDAAEYYNDTPQAELNSTSEIPPSTSSSAAEEASVLATMSSAGGEGAMKPVEEFDSVKTNVTGNMKAADFFDGAASFPSPPAYRRNGDKLSNPSRIGKHGEFDGLEMGARSDARLNESQACRAVRQVGGASACPPIFPSVTIPPSCYALPAIDDSPQTFYVPLCPTNNIRISDPEVSCLTYSGTRTQCNNLNTNPRIKTLHESANSIRGCSMNADPRTSNQPHQISRSAVPRRGCNHPNTAAAPSTTRGTAGIMNNSGNGKGDNSVCSSSNALTGSSCSDPCSNQKACMISDSGNGRGGNKVKSCINYITGGNMLYNCGQGEGGNYIESGCNIIGGNGASLIDGSNGAVLQSLYNMVIGQNCSLFGCNCHCGDDESNEEDDPCCSPPTKRCPCSDHPGQPSTPIDNCPQCIILPGNAFMYPNKKK